MPSLGSGNNAVLVDNCQDLQNLTVTLIVAEEALVTCGDTGFSLQLNCYPQIGSISPNATPQTGPGTLTWFQYVLIVANNQATWQIQYWANDAYAYSQAGPGGNPPQQNWPPPQVYSPNPPGTSPWLPVFPGTAVTGTISGYSAASNSVPPQSKLEIKLKTDMSGNVTGATFSITDPSGVVYSGGTKPWQQYAGVPEPPQYALYPIYGFQVDLVGLPGSNCNFTSGTGTLTYSVSPGTLAVQDASTACGGPQPGTAEQSNAAYGGITPSAGSMVSQRFYIQHWQHVAYVDGNSHVIEAFYPVGQSGPLWQFTDITGQIAQAGGPDVSSNSGLTSWADCTYEHVVYIGNGDVIEAFNPFVQGEQQRQFTDITAQTQANNAPSGSPLTSWVDATYQHVVYISTNGDVIEAFYPVGQSGQQWRYTDITGQPGAPGVAFSSSPLTSWVT
jgi:hypothetical protein